MHDDSTEGEEMKRQQRRKVMKDMTKKIRLKGRMDADNRWWVGGRLRESVAPSRRGRNRVKMVCLVGKMKREDEKRKKEEMDQQKVAQMIKSAEGSAGLVHKITKSTTWRGGAQMAVGPLCSKEERVGKALAM